MSQCSPTCNEILDVLDCGVSLQTQLLSLELGLKFRPTCQENLQEWDLLDKACNLFS